MDIEIKKNSGLHTNIVFLNAYKTLKKNVGKTISKSGLTETQFGVLDVLYSKGPITISELLVKILGTSGNITVVLKNMERNGLITKTISREDNRKCIIAITDKGKEVFEKILPLHREEVEIFFEFLTGEEKESLIKILKKFKTKKNK